MSVIHFHRSAALSRYDLFHGNLERRLVAFHRLNEELRQELAIAMAKDTDQQEHDRLKERTGQLQREHDALDSPPTTPESAAEHVEHRRRVRTHQDDLAEHRKRQDS